ncbi:MAG TPA: hypothetical protein VI756_32960, partial [Blastocatellia bacterium]
ALVTQPAFAQTTTPTSLVGSWQLTLTPSTSTTGVAGLANFTSDGGGIATSADGILVGPASGAPSALNPAFGNWNICAACTGPANQANMEFIGDITNSDGSIAGTRTFTATVVVSSSGSFSGSYQLVVTVGTISALSDGTITGALIPHFTPPSS